jgi:hypothetical protein
MWWIVFNVLGFQAVWWACVLGASAGWGWAGPLAVATFAAVHLRFTPTAARDLRLLVAAVLLGLVVDGLLGASGLLAYAAAGGTPALAPAWILALWCGFALTLTHSMAFFARRPLAAAAFGLVGGPLAYAGAAAVAGAVAFPLGSVPALAAVAVAWALALPLLYAVDRRFVVARREVLA